MTSPPACARRSRTSGERAAASVAAVSLASTGLGVPAGAIRPYQTEASKPGKPDSAMVGTSGSRLERFALETAIAEQGGNPQDTIVAGGNQACDPHDRGSGPLRPHELIIIDIFPRVVKTGYFGDMTRTYLKGRPSEEQRKLVATVRKAQLAATKTIRAGVDGRAVHKACTDCFAAAGYITKQTKDGAVGFIHGTGHGLGLAVHDPGRMSPAVSYPLKKGSVMTVEPGLYYPGLGGCRWEDVVQVTATGTKPLSKYPYNWEIR